MHLGNICLSQKGICTVYFGDKKKMRLLYHIVHSRNMNFGEIQQMSKSKKIAPRKKVAVKLLYHRLGHRSTRSLIAWDTENVCKDI